MDALPPVIVEDEVGSTHAIGRKSACDGVLWSSLRVASVVDLGRRSKREIVAESLDATLTPTEVARKPDQQRFTLRGDSKFWVTRSVL